MALETLPHNKTTTIYVEDVEEGSNLKSSNAEVGYKKKNGKKEKGETEEKRGQNDKTRKNKQKS